MREGRGREGEREGSEGGRERRGRMGGRGGRMGNMQGGSNVWFDRWMAYFYVMASRVHNYRMD